MECRTEMFTEEGRNAKSDLLDLAVERPLTLAAAARQG